MDVIDWFGLDLPSDLIHPQEERTNEQKNCQMGEGDTKAEASMICKLDIFFFSYWKCLHSFASCHQRYVPEELCKPNFCQLNHMCYAVVNCWGKLKQSKTKQSKGKRNKRKSKPQWQKNLVLNVCLPPSTLSLVLWSHMSITFLFHQMEATGWLPFSPSLGEKSRERIGIYKWQLSEGLKVWYRWLWRSSLQFI